MIKATSHLARFREPFSLREIHAMVSFACDNPLLPVGSRRTWDIFIQETGSKRNPDSLKSQASSVQFKHNVNLLQGTASFSHLRLVSNTPASPPPVHSLPSSSPAVVTEPTVLIEKAPASKPLSSARVSASAAKPIAGAGAASATFAAPTMNPSSLPLVASEHSNNSFSPAAGDQTLSSRGSAHCAGANAVSQSCGKDDAEQTFARVSSNVDFRCRIVRNVSHSAIRCELLLMPETLRRKCRLQLFSKRVWG